MDSVVGDDPTLPVDMNGSCRLTDSIDAVEYSPDSMTAAPFFTEKMSPIKALTMKDYENQITALKKENFNLKLRIYFMEERMQQKCVDSTEDIFKTNIELKVELESMKREMAEKQELLISASKALESFAGRDSREPQLLREQAQKEMDALRDAFNKRIVDLEQSLQAAEVEIDRMAAIAEQEKLKSINMEKQLQTVGANGTFPLVSVPKLQQAMQEKDNLISQLKDSLKNQEALLQQQKNYAEQTRDAPPADQEKRLSDLLTKRDLELEALRNELLTERNRVPSVSQESEINHLESLNQQLTEELTHIRNANETLTKTLENNQEETKNLSKKLEEKENDLNSEKKNALKRDKTIQGLTQVLREKENEIADLCHEIEDRNEALSKAREAVHKAQLQKYQGAEEHQNLLMAKQTELAQLQGEHHIKVLESQKLQRALDRKEQELADLQQAKDQLEVELEDTQQQKKKGDKALNDLLNQHKKLSGEIKDRESALEQQYQDLLDQTKQKLKVHEITIQRLTATLMDKEQQLQEYMNMISEQSKSPEGIDGILSKLRQRLKEKEKALEQAVDEKFAAIEDKDNEIHQLQLSLREKERDLERLNSLVSHNEETINSLDTVIKEKDVELQHLANELKNLQRSKQDVEVNLNRSLREKDSIISQLQLSLEGKTKDLEELAALMRGQSQSHAHDFAEQMSQRLKVTEAMLAEAVKAREKLVADNENAIEELLATINSKDQRLKESAEHYKCMLSQRTQEIEDLKKQLLDRQQHLNTLEKQWSTRTQDSLLEAADLRLLLEEKECIITKLLQQGKERDQYMREMGQMEESAQILKLRHTIQIMQEKLSEKEAEESDGKNKELNQALQIECKQTTLHQHSGQKSECAADDPHDQTNSSGLERFSPKLPQRERTIIGGDSKQKALPTLLALQQEHEALNKALKAEQQLYSSLVRTVKEQDSAQRLHALQLELTAVQLLRQQLEESIKTNEELRDDLEREMHRAKLKEGMDLIDPKELECMRNQLEDAQRWNASLQARLGAIQNRGGGVGGTNDGGDSLSFIGDQTSYMSICVGEEQDDSLTHLSAQELREKVLELQDCISRLHTLNRDLQNRLSPQEKADDNRSNKEEEDSQKIVTPVLWKQQSLAHQDKESQTDITLDQIISQNLLNDMSIKSSVGQARDHTQSGNNAQENDSSEEMVNMAPTSLQNEHEVSSVSHLKEKLDRLQLENVRLQSLLKEQASYELKEQESMEASGERSDDMADSPKSVKIPQTKAEDFANNSLMLNEHAKKSNITGLEIADTKMSERNQSDGSFNRKSRNLSRGASRSRLPVPVRLRTEAGGATPEHQLVSAVHGCDSQIPDSDSLSSLCSTSTQRSHFPLESDTNSQIIQTTNSSQSDAPLVSQLELLHQECRDKESLINELREKLADFKELHTQLQEKENLNYQYIEALQAAESTIAYLTACSLDSQGALGSGFNGSNTTLYNQYLELQQASKDKEQSIYQLTELLNKADKLLRLSKSHNHNYDISDLGINITDALQKYSSRNKDDDFSCSSHELQQHDSLMLKAWSDQEDNTAELEEKLQAADAPVREDHRGHSSRNQLEAVASQFDANNYASQQRINIVLMNCLNAAELAIASLTEHCTNTHPSRSSVTYAELQTCLNKLKRALQEKEELGDLTQFPTQTKNNTNCSTSDQTKEQLSQGPHHNLQVLYEAFSGLQQKMSELQASQKSSDVQRPVHDTKALPPNVQNQIETLHKELREKKKACKSLEEKLATAQSFMATPCPGAIQKALKQDDKGVQVDFQDLGYETSGKSEYDREESSSTDLEVGVKPSCSASSLHSLLKQEQTAFSSTENLYSISSTYPTSPVLSSAKVCIKTSSLSSDLAANTSEPSVTGDQEDVLREAHNQDRLCRTGQGEGKAMKDTPSCLNTGSKSRESLGKNLSDLLQSRSGSTSPARLESLVQSQAKELSQLREEIRDSRRLGALQREQLEDLGKAFSNLIQSAKLDNLMGEEVKKQLDRSLAIMDCLEGRLDKSRHCLDGEFHLGDENAALEVSHSGVEDLEQGSLHLCCKCMNDSPAKIQQEIDKLRVDLEDERELLQQHVTLLVQQNLTLANCTREQLDLLAKELQEKNQLIQTLQCQPRGQSPSSHHSSHSDLYHLDESPSSCHSSLSKPTQSQQHSADWARTGGAGVLEEGVPGHRDTVSRLQGLQRENNRLHEQLRNTKELNTSLRNELDLHCTIMAQSGSHGQAQGKSHNRDESGPQTEISPDERGSSSPKPCLLTTDLLAEHLQEIRALRQRLEESIKNNDSLREQLEKKLAEVEKDPALTNIFIHETEEHGQLTTEMQSLWQENQTLKEQLNSETRDKQESKKLRETVASRTAKLEQSRKEYEKLRQENFRLQERLELLSQENAELQNSLYSSKEELHRLQCEAKLQGQQLADSKHLLQSLRVELQVHENLRCQENGQSASGQGVAPTSGPVDLRELLTEIRHLRLQLERSIQTNTALRQKLEEQLARGPNHSETININYLLTSDDAARSPGRESQDPLQHSGQARVIYDHKQLSEEDGGSMCSSSAESISGAPSRLVPGHRMWANRSGRHILGLIEDYSALRKQISEGRKLSHSMDTQLQECILLINQSSDKLIEHQHLKSLCTNMNTMQQVLEEASRLLKLLWRVSLPVDLTAWDIGTNQQDDLLKKEITRLKNRLSQQEKMLSGAVKRLRTTNQLKEGMERVIIDQLSLTHGVLKKARGNLETNYCTLIGLKGLSGGPGNPSEWPVADF